MLTRDGKAASGLERILSGSSGKKSPRKAWIGALVAAIWLKKKTLKTALNNIQSMLTRTHVQAFVDRIEKIVGKGENAGTQYFLLFPQCFILFNEEKTTAITKCDLIPPASALTETNILYTDGHTDGRTEVHTDGQTG